MKEHDLKTHPEPFEAMLRGDKTCEFRKDDREPRFEIGDLLILREWNPDAIDFGKSKDAGIFGQYTGRGLQRVVTDVRRGGVYGIPEGYAMLSVKAATL